MNEQPRKILLLSPQPFFQARGTPINVREMLYALSEDGYHVTLLCYPFGENIQIKNVDIIRSYKPPFVHGVKIGPSFTKIYLDIFFALKALIVSMRSRYTVYHGIEEAGLIAGFLGILFKKPFIVDVDSSMAHQLKESGFITSRLILSVFEKCEAFFFSRAHRVITVCEALTQEVKKLAPTAHIAQIEDFPLEYTASHQEEFNIRTRFHITQNKKIILYAGNFEPYQGIDLLIESFKILHESSPGVAILMLIGGTDAHIAHYKDLAQRFGLSEHIVFTGHVESTLMGEIHAQADILVSPRILGTNTPLKIYSYLQAGKTIVATNIYSHTQVLNNTCALLADPSPDSFSKMLVLACDESNYEHIKEISANAKHLAETKYSRETFHASLKKVYRSL